MSTPFFFLLLTSRFLLSSHGSVFRTRSSHSLLQLGFRPQFHNPIPSPSSSSMDLDKKSEFGFDPCDVAEQSPCGNYVRFEKLLGRGAFKDVYRGFDRIGNAEIAWNQICFEDEETLNSPGNQERLFAEAVLVKSLNHPNIMKCHTSWLDRKNKNVNMITELFTSGSLRQYMKKLGGLDLPTVKDVARQILQGLHYLHTRAPCVIHRDLKCDNIFVHVGSGEIKIGDFGLATEMEQAPVRVLAGTPEFMAPEYYDEEYDELVDIYAFGLCLMEMATLEYPYCECTNPAQIFKKVSNAVKPASLGKVQDLEVKGIIEKCLSPVSMRPSALELLRDPFFSSEKVPMVVEINVAGDQSWCVDEAILSGISMLYNSMSLLSGGPRCVDKLHGSSCDQSSGGDDDVSMNSRITFASSSCAVSKDF